MRTLHAKKILIVEDDSFLKDLLAMKFSKEGADLIFAESGDVVVELVKNEKPRIILLDLVLSGMNGFEVLERLKADTETSSIHVMVLSNLGEEGDVEKGKALCAADFLIKAHVSMDEIISKVRGIING